MRLPLMLKQSFYLNDKTPLLSAVEIAQITRIKLLKFYFEMLLKS